MRSSNDGPARRGFVLLEAALALAIISLIALGVLGATTVQVRTADKAALLLTAAALADERMATLKSLQYDDLRSLPDSLAAGSFPPPFAEYGWRAESAEADGEHDLFTLAVVVTVHDESFSLYALVHEPRPLVEAAAEGAAQ